MFNIEEIAFGPLTVFRLKNGNSGEYADIIPGHGATLNALVLKNSEGKLLQLVDGSPNYEYLKGQGTSAYKGCVLFPFPNRIADGAYTFDGITRHFPINHPSENNALHGTLYDKEFLVFEKAIFSDEVQLILVNEGDGSDDSWPFAYRLEVAYVFNKSGLTSTIRVTNISNATMPVGVGTHPYFTLGSTIDNLTYSMSAGHTLGVDSRLIPTGEQFVAPTYNKAHLADLQFDTCFQTIPGNERSFASIYSSELNTTLHVWMETDMGEHFLQVYTPPGRKSIAIEPMSCAPDAFNNGLGLRVLDRGEKLALHYGINLL